jgi:four helix bundle protein
MKNAFPVDNGGALIMSFEYRNKDIYKESKIFYKIIQKIVFEKKTNRIITDQIIRASLSIVLNFAEGYGRFHSRDKRNFYVNARASVNECVACLDVIFNSQIPEEVLQKADHLGKMLSGLIKVFKK